MNQTVEIKRINYKKVAVQNRIKTICSYVFLILFAAIFLVPVLIVAMNSLKSNLSIQMSASSLFALPNKESWVAFSNYVTAMTFGEYPFLKSFAYSLIITITSTAAILVFTSMAAWFISRVNNLACKIVFTLCIFSMIVPFQMLMFTLSKTADSLHLNNPYLIWIVYLGFGAGMAIFMFTGFIKSVPLEIEEAASIDGCNPIQTFFLVIFPICKPTMISVGILEIMWIWNDYLLPYLSLDITKYRTLPIHVQYLQGSYGRVDLGATMAIIMMCLLPIIIIYIFCQKYIIKGVVDGAVK